MPRSALLTLLLCSSALNAQFVVTSPKGMETTAGNATFAHWGANRRFQQIDASHMSSFLLVKSVSFRRAAAGGGSGAGPRTLDLELRMGHANFGMLSSDMDKNYLAEPAVVFTRKSVNLPDWTGSAGSPAPFDFRVPLDTPFLYAGWWAMVVDFTVENPSVTTQATTDRQYVGPVSSTGTLVGTGCTATGQTATFSHTAFFQNNGAPGRRYGMRLRAAGTRAPAHSPVLLLADIVDSSLDIPGLCGLLHVMPVVILNLGTADASGTVRDVHFSFPFDADLEGGAVFTQLLAPDVGQLPMPVVFSNARRTSMPLSTATAGHDTAYIWSTLPSATGTVFFGGGMVLGIDAD